MKETTKFVLFQVANQKFACPLEKIYQVIESTKIEKVPRTIPWFSGVMNYHGNLYEIADLRTYLDKSIESESSCIILLQHEVLRIGVIVDAVERVVTVNKEDITTNQGKEYCKAIGIEGLLKIEEKIVQLMNFDLFIDSLHQSVKEYES